MQPERQKNPPLRSQRGFTLVELLVTITIIIAISGLALVGMKNARTSANMIVAANRVKGLGLANATYAADNGGRYVPIITDENGGPAVQWHFNAEFLSALIGELKVLEGVIGYEGVDGIPQSVLDPVTVKAKKRYWNRLSGSFGHNQEWMPAKVAWGVRGTADQHTIMSIKNPSQTFNFITSTDWLVRYDARYFWLKKPIEGKTENGQIAYRHKGKAIAVFYDGHTEFISPSDMKKLDAKGGRDNGFWGGSR